MYWDKNSVEIGIDEIKRCQPTILLKFKQLLNGYHSESQSIEYYDLIASDWLEPFTNLVYDAMQDVLAGKINKEPSYISVSSAVIKLKS
jgi:hypothetical protein